MSINGQNRPVQAESRVSLLDALREYLDLTGTKKGCNQGACGACRVLVDGERTLSCLALAVQFEGRQITTIEGLAAEGLHPLQAAFVEHDGFQCGYCTPGQICSIGMIEEFGEKSVWQYCFVMSNLISESSPPRERCGMQTLRKDPRCPTAHAVGWICRTVLSG